MENLFFIFLMILFVVILCIYAYEEFTDSTTYKEEFKLKPKFPYLELMGLTVEEAEEKYDCKDVLSKCIKRSNVIVGFKFYYKEHYDYRKYYQMLEEFAKANNIAIIEEPTCMGEFKYFKYEVVDFNPSNENCGLIKLDKNKNREYIERECDKLLANDMKEIVFLGGVKEYKQKQRKEEYKQKQRKGGK